MFAHAARAHHTGGAQGVYDTSDGTYKNVSGDFVIGTPRVFWRTSTDTLRKLWPAQDLLRGTGFLRRQVCGVMVYPLVLGTYYAFYLKPIGVDWLSVSLNSTADHQIVAVGHYVDTPEAVRRAPVGDWRATNNSFRFCVFDATPQVANFANKSLDSADALSKLTLYARNTATGVISETFATELVNVRRQANISMSFEPRRIGG
jgi:hypothetical protein